MRKIFAVMVFMLALAPAVFADTGDPYPAPQKETVILRLDTGNQITSDDIQKLFTALGTSYLKSNSSYILAYEVYRDWGRQELRSSLVLTELDYGSFVVMNIRHTFSNGYYELKLSNSPFINLVNNEPVNSVDYNGEVGRDVYRAINDKLQEVVYISRGYAAGHKKKSTASFYVFR
ncbi:hypothetical protein FACS1894141_4390 [Spirochaetia bacterium]|nr:hypothetical protein FACS1894141_4390 [Spirochaetia bacterium]